MAKTKEATVADLISDDKNFNKGNPYGESLIEKSFQKFGAGRSVLIDKSNRIIAGNKSHQKFADSGGQKVIIVETTGDTLVAVKRTDIDLDSKQGRELALADNAASKANIEWDMPVMDMVAEEWDIDTEEWRVDGQNNNETKAAITEGQWYLNVKCNDERDTQQLYERLTNDGYECKIIS